MPDAGLQNKCVLQDVNNPHWGQDDIALLLVAY